MCLQKTQAGKFKANFFVKAKTHFDRLVDLAILDRVNILQKSEKKRRSMVRKKQCFVRKTMYLPITDYNWH